MTTPRIAPGTRAELGLLNWVLIQAGGRLARTGAPNVMTTLGRHRGLFRRWVFFAGGLMPGGKLPRQDTELVILRVAHLCASAYELDHHERIGARVGLSTEQIERASAGATADGWSPRHAAILQATDELHADQCIAEVTWTRLRVHLDERELIELCLLAGHYTMLAGALNSLGVQLDARPGRRARKP